MRASMSKSSPAKLKQIPSIDEWMDTPFVEKVIENKGPILAGIGAVIALLVLSYVFISQKTAGNEQDYFLAERDFNQFVQKDGTQEELDRLQAMMRLHPELQARYDGAIAQTLLIRNEAAQAQPFATSLFKRTASDHMEAYRAFGEATLLIASGNNAEAYTRTKQLQQKLEASPGKETLYLFNLIRLATLQQLLGNTQEERVTWGELQSYLGSHPEALALIAQVFKEAPTALNLYAEQRKAVIK